MAEIPESIGGKIRIIRQHLDKVLIGLAAIAMGVSGYLTYDYKQQMDCQLQLLTADRQFTSDFSSAMVILMSQPPAPVEQRRLAFERVRDALVEKQRVQAELGDCK